MGCTCEKPNYSTEELMIIHEEYKLRFCKVNLIKCLRVFSTYSHNNILTRHDFEDAMDILRLPYASRSDDCIEDFYKGFSVSNEFTMRMLTVAAIFLCDAKILEKIEVLFDAYDYDRNQSLSSRELESLLSDLYEVACIDLPRLVSYRSTGADFTTVLNYMRMIRTVKQKVNADMRTALLQADSAVSRCRFIERMSRPPLSCLLSSSAFRNLHKETFDKLDDITKYQELRQFFR